MLGTTSSAQTRHKFNGKEPDAYNTSVASSHNTSSRVFKVNLLRHHSLGSTRVLSNTSHGCGTGVEQGARQRKPDRCKRPDLTKYLLQPVPEHANDGGPTTGAVARPTGMSRHWSSPATTTLSTSSHTALPPIQIRGFELPETDETALSPTQESPVSGSLLLNRTSSGSRISRGRAGEYSSGTSPTIEVSSEGLVTMASPSGFFG